MEKRTNKTEAELRAELKQKAYEKKKQDFLKEYEESSLKIFRKYGLTLVPALRYTDQGLYPVYAVDIFNEKQPESKTNGQPDTNDKASAK